MIAEALPETDATDATALLPQRFARIAAAVPARLDKELGYFGEARFCFFYYDAQADGVVWKDGRSYGFGAGAWRPFDEQIEPLARAQGVALGGRRPQDHVLLIDRLRRAAYFTPRSTAERIIGARQELLTQPPRTDPPHQNPRPVS